MVTAALRYFAATGDLLYAWKEWTAMVWEMQVAAMAQQLIGARARRGTTTGGRPRSRT